MNLPAIKIHSLCVSQNYSGMRLDLFLSSQIDQLSRTYLKNIIEQGLVKVSDATVIEPDFRVKLDQLVQVTVPAPRPVDHRAQDIELKIYYEDDDVLVLEKQAGLVVHPSPGHPDSTLVNALISHCGSSLSGIGGVTRPGIVHRLDKDTSGLMIVAKNDGPHLCIKCFNKDTRDKDQGFKAQALINQDSRAGQFISCEKKAQGSRVKP